MNNPLQFGVYKGYNRWAPDPVINAVITAINGQK